MIKHTFQGLLLLMVLACHPLHHPHYSMETYALRLTPGQDLKQEIQAFAAAQQMQAGFVLTCVGSLQTVRLRPTNQQTALERQEKFEIVSLVGTIAPDGVHLHIALSDSLGNTLGGHLLDGNKVYTTAEIVLGEAKNLRFSRKTDPQTTFKELHISPR
jgi:uncharacterized protein